MIIHPQGSAGWHADRLGKITASRFDAVLTNAKKKGDLSKTAQDYMLDLVAEILTGTPQGFKGNKATEWGNDQEPFAVKAYEARTGNVCTEVGFVKHPTESRVGGSPDRLVGEDGGLEIKCPYNTRVHLQYVLGGCLPDEHEAQVQGHIWINDKKWWDFGSYDPRLADPKLGLFIVHVERDPAYIKHLQSRVAAFRDQMIAHLKTIMKGLSE
ncbi:MAG TPA: YqaJ viral recombinase family protein [Planctomycetota bacterium]|nr:YqaJ viral recombinase family protein [Planctomycetota bacterium]